MTRSNEPHGRHEELRATCWGVSDRGAGPRRTAALMVRIVVVAFTMVVGPATTWAGACDDKLGETVQVTGAYVVARQAYAQAFVFGMRLDCHGQQELVTVQRSTGDLPVCSPEQPVEVVGKLVWNRALVDGHYEINNPSKVVCVPQAQAESKAAEPRAVPPTAPVASTTKVEPRRVEAKGVASSLWIGRYQDSRGAGEMTFTLVVGTSTVSGTWTLRTGGGGPVAGTLEGDGRRLQFRMENLAPECPGTFEGVAEVNDNTLVGTYHGQDCQGAVSDGRVDLRLR